MDHRFNGMWPTTLQSPVPGLRRLSEIETIEKKGPHVSLFMGCNQYIGINTNKKIIICCSFFFFQFKTKGGTNLLLLFNR